LYQLEKDVCKLCANINFNAKNKMLKYSQNGVTISMFFDQRRQTATGKYPVKFNICYHRERKYYNTGIYLSAEDCNMLFETKKRDLIHTRTKLENIYLKLKHCVEIILSKGTFSFDVLWAMMSGTVSDKTVNEAFLAKIKYLNDNDQIKTAEICHNAINSFARFAGRTIFYQDINVNWLKTYDKYMCSKGKSPTTIGIYLRQLRTIFNEAIKAGYVDKSLYPFGQNKDGKYEMPECAGRKLALSAADMKKVFEYTNENDTIMQNVDLWKFSYLSSKNPHPNLFEYVC
jgi:hypothetical protein